MIKVKFTPGKYLTSKDIAFWTETFPIVFKFPPHLYTQATLWFSFGTRGRDDHSCLFLPHILSLLHVSIYTNSKCKHHGHITPTGLVVILLLELQDCVSINAIHFQTFYLPLHLHKCQNRHGHTCCSTREKGAGIAGFFGHKYNWKHKRRLKINSDFNFKWF